MRRRRRRHFTHAAQKTPNFYSFIFDTLIGTGALFCSREEKGEVFARQTLLLGRAIRIKMNWVLIEYKKGERAKRFGRCESLEPHSDGPSLSLSLRCRRRLFGGFSRVRIEGRGAGGGWVGGWVGGHTIHQAYLPLQGFLPLIDLQSECAIFLFLCRRCCCCWAKEREKEKKQHPDKIARHFFWDLVAISLLISARSAARELRPGNKSCLYRCRGAVCNHLIIWTDYSQIHLYFTRARSVHRRWMDVEKLLANLSISVLIDEFVINCC